MDRYLLECLACGRTQPDDGIMVHCAHSHQPSLLRTKYRESQFKVDEHARSLMRYASWLPLREHLHASGQTAVFFEQRLNDALGMTNLWVALNGHHPRRNALLRTATFKDIEASAILGRFPRDGRILVAASAGNTAIALVHACDEHRVPAVIVAPEDALSGLRFDTKLSSRIKFVSIFGEATYDDAIVFARSVGRSEPFVFEGGAANVARRDGIGTTMLAAVEALGRLPDYYVQAIGSGAGAIGAHEAAGRLILDGRYGSRFPRLVLVQNSPSAPVFEAWAARKSSLFDGGDDDSARTKSLAIAARVLGTQHPPYAIAGGLYSILCESDGNVVVVDNDEVYAARRLYERIEAIDIELAGAAALAGLQQAVRAGQIAADALVVLHITGAGRAAQKERFTHAVERALRIDRRALGDEAHLRSQLLHEFGEVLQ